MSGEVRLNISDIMSGIRLANSHRLLLTGQRLLHRFNVLLNSSGPGYTLPLCPGVQYFIQAPILFAAPNQEISTVGYPTGDERATLIVDGPVANGQGHTTAVDGTCNNCSGVKLRYVQVSTFLCFL